MTILAWPAALGIRNIEWMPPDEPAQQSRSEWTGDTQTVITPSGGARWTAKVTLAPLLGQQASLALQLFRARLNGIVNQVRLCAVEEPQCDIALPLTVNGPGQTGYSLNVTGGYPGVRLQGGFKVTVSDQLIMLGDDVTFDSSGHATLPLLSRLRSSPANAASVEAINPTGLMSLTAGQPGWTVDPGQEYSAPQISFEESF